MISYVCPKCSTVIDSWEMPPIMSATEKFDCPHCASRLTLRKLDVFEEVFNCPNCNENGMVHEENGLYYCENCGEEFDESQIDTMNSSFRDIVIEEDDDYDYWS